MTRLGTGFLAGVLVGAVGAVLLAGSGAIPAAGAAQVWIQNPGSLLPQIVFDNPVPAGVVNAVNNYAPPCDPNTLHSFGLGVDAASLFNFPGVCFYVNEQVVFTPAGGAPVISNLQVSYDG